MLSTLALLPTAACALAAPAPARAVVVSRGASPTMIQNYDVDKVDKLENKISLGRRALIPAIGFAGISGGLLSRNPSSPVLPGTETYSEMARLTAVPRAAEAASEKYFPGALGSYAMDRLVAQTLERRGYTKDNTLFASSICPDEINFIPGEMVDLMKTRWGENFALGGLAGLPFVGKAGFGAYSHHVPEGGKALIVFAPHVGIDADGTVGKIKRENQNAVSTACGAAVGGYKAIMANKGVVSKSSDPDYDAQIGFIVEKLAPKVAPKVAEAPDAIAFTTYQMYLLAREYFVTQLIESNFWDDATEVTVIGGIQINRAVGGDRFMPLMMQSRRQAKGTVVDLYEETFGKAPDLNAALGGLVSNAEVFTYPLGQ